MSLDPYVSLLLADLAAAKSRRPDVPKYLYDDYGPELSHLAELERAPCYPMSEWLGIPKDTFPPVDRLTDAMVEQLVKAIIDLWQAFNFFPVLPDPLPVRCTYNVLVGAWDRDIQFISEGRQHIEFCSYEPAQCPFPQSYCMCKDLDEGINT